MGIVLDLIVIAIILIFCLISAKKGFVKTIVEAVGVVAAIILAFTFSSPLAATTYDKIIEPPILNAVSSETTESSENAVQNIWDSMPKFIINNADTGKSVFFKRFGYIVFIGNDYVSGRIDISI